jgi:glutamyl-tRNA synthetase
MAPSPTGEYHIGHIRTVLYNYAFAKKHNGSFIIRIEDTDRARFVPGAQERILDVIKRYGLSWDEGPDKGGKFGPYVQSERLEIYREYANKLIEKGKAYRCYCSVEELQKMREEQQFKGYARTMYDGRCRNLTQEEISANEKENKPYVIRLKVPKDEKINFEDEIYGYLEFETNEIDDTVLLKSDGYPTYHLAVVIDDHLMKISHIMRGNDWLPSTPKHILLYQAFGWEPPKFIHLPNLKEKGANRKLSKRFGSVFAIDFLKEGYLPEALLNFLMFLGWNPGGEREIYSLPEFVEKFSLERIHKTDLVAFDREKLLWMNGYYLRNMSPHELWQQLQHWSADYGIDLHVDGAEEAYNVKVVSLIQERMKTMGEFVSLTHYFYQDPLVEKKQLFKYVKEESRGQEILRGLRALYQNVEKKDWNLTNLENSSHLFIENNEYRPKEAFMTLRLAVTGEKATPPIFDILEVVGRDTALNRLEEALKV